MTVQASERRVEIERVPRYPADAVLDATEVVDARTHRPDDPAGDLRQELGEGTQVARTLDPRTVQPGSVRIERPIEAARWLSLRLAREAW